MKSKFGILAVIFSFVSVCSFAQAKTDTIKVWGNCEMCKGHIENAAKDAGATTASWSEVKKLLVVSYDTTATSNMDIQKKIAAAGYDTQDVKAEEASYKKLDKCCQYKRPEQKSSGQ